MHLLWFAGEGEWLTLSGDEPAPSVAFGESLAAELFTRARTVTNATTSKPTSALPLDSMQPAPSQPSQVWGALSTNNAARRAVMEADLAARLNWIDLARHTLQALVHAPTNIDETVLEPLLGWHLHMGDTSNALKLAQRLPQTVRGQELRCAAAILAGASDVASLATLFSSACPSSNVSMAPCSFQEGDENRRGGSAGVKSAADTEDWGRTGRRGPQLEAWERKLPSAYATARNLCASIRRGYSQRTETRPETGDGRGRHPFEAMLLKACKNSTSGNDPTIEKRDCRDLPCLSLQSAVVQRKYGSARQADRNVDRLHMHGPAGGR